MTELVLKIAKAHYVANEHTVEMLAAERYIHAAHVGSSDGTYLRILATECQARLGKGRRTRVDKQTQLSVLDTAHLKFYPAVLRGVTTADIVPDPSLEAEEQRRRSQERNSRSNFARTAMYALKRYTEAGGDLRSLDIPTLTKSQLRAAVAPPEPENKVERQITRAEGALLRAVARRARGDPDGAAEDIRRVMDELQKALDDLESGTEEQAATTTVVARSPQRTRVGLPSFTP